ncbi:MAG: UDP-N-acetylmuramoyl-L-alanine--D-glutamate ligase [Thermoflexales bacterium]
MTNWEGKRVVILGAARQGIALTRYLLGKGAQVVLSDAKPARALDLAGLPAVSALTLALGGHPLTLLEGCEVLCLSGGVPIDLPIVLEARRVGVPLSNDAEMFFELCPAPIIGITGSAGKTTTTTLLGEMLRAHESGSGGNARRVWVGGNIGNPLIEHVDRIGPRDHVVMELSSFQLDLMSRSPPIACITNITPNHLDRHGTMAAYVAAKKRILDFQAAGDVQVLCADDPISSALNTVAQIAWFSLRAEPQGDGAWLDEDGFLRLRIRKSRIEDTICHRSELLLMGDHNVLNVLAAAALAASAGAGLPAIRGVARSFRGVAHRLQFVRELNGVRYYDDSIATAPERMLADLRCFAAPIVLLCGGRDKKLPWDEAAAEMARRCEHIALFGEMAGMVQSKLAAAGIEPSRMSAHASLPEAVRRAVSVARPGSIVLLSPGGTSYDAYKDFAERGDKFTELITELH